MWTVTPLYDPSRTGARLHDTYDGCCGRVSEVNFRGSHDQPKLVPIDKQADDEVMHLNRLGKTDGLTGQALDPGSQPQVFPFDLLRMSFARLVLRLVDLLSAPQPRIDTATYQRLREHLDDRELLELGAALSVASGWQRFIEAFGIRPDRWTEAMPLPWHADTF
jgi:hypothetical protein